MKNAPAMIIIMFPVSALAKPVYVRNSLKLLDMKSKNPMACCLLRLLGFTAPGLCVAYHAVDSCQTATATHKPMKLILWSSGRHLPLPCLPC